MIHTLALPHWARILEIGCGRGVALSVLAERLSPTELVGLDVDSALLAEARVLRDGGLFVHETRVAQRLAHPLRSFGRALPWRAVPSLVPDRRAMLWGVRRKIERVWR